MILAVDPGLQDLGWAVVAPRTGRVAALGTLHQPRLKKLDKSTCRATRARRQGELLSAIAREHRCSAIAAEAMSFAGNKFNMVLSVGLAWGVLEGVAAALGLEQSELVPRVWQHAVLGREPGDRSAVDYDDVFRRLSEFIGREGSAAEQLEALPVARRIMRSMRWASACSPRCGRSRRRGLGQAQSSRLSRQACLRSLEGRTKDSPESRTPRGSR